MIEYKKAVSAADLVVNERSDQVMIGHKDNLSDGIFCMRLEEFDSLTEEEIVDRFNAYIDSLLDGIVNDRPIEIVHGQPQVKWDKTGKQWIAVGDVLRCELGWDSEEETVSIVIDDVELAGHEFLRLLAVNEGWGMRVEFVHPNRLLNPPEPVFQKTREK